MVALVLEDTMKKEDKEKAVVEEVEEVAAVVVPTLHELNESAKKGAIKRKEAEEKARK